MWKNSVNMEECLLRDTEKWSDSKPGRGEYILPSTREGTLFKSPYEGTVPRMWQGYESGEQQGLYSDPDGWKEILKNSIQSIVYFQNWTELIFALIKMLFSNKANQDFENLQSSLWFCFSKVVLLLAIH